MANEFLDATYTVPKGNSDYMKIEQGDNTFRILGKPLIGWSYWNATTNKPVRIAGVEQPIVDKTLIKPDLQGKQNLKHFWAMLVWNYKLNQIQIFETTTGTIQTAIQSLSNNPKWGSPFNFDITINKTGQKLETKYTIMPEPPTPISEEIKAAARAKPCVIGKLLTGENPFETAPVAAPVTAQAVAPIATPIAIEGTDLPF